jgi:trk system potassium uptake protein TrkH
MRYRVVIKVLSLIIIFTSLAMLLALPFSYYYGDGAHTALFVSSGIGIILSIPGLFFIPKRHEDIRAKEGFAIVTLGWISFAVIGALPFMLSGTTTHFADAFFETMSGFTTTGATILTDIESVPHGILFWRSLTHWLGGMGIIVLTIAILPFLGVGGMQMFKAESPGPTVDKLSPRIASTAKILWGVYVFFTLFETGLLMLAGMSLFDALCHSFGTLATGGFSTKNASIGAYSSATVDYIIIVFMIIAGTNFSLHYKLFTGKFSDFFKNTEFRFFVSIIGVATLIIFLEVMIFHYHDAGKSIQHSLFQVSSIMTTTGYGTADYEKWSVAAQVILFMLMFIGGSAGSTGGGIKVIRLLLLLKFAYNELIRLLHPNAIVAVKVGGQVIDQRVLINVAGFFIIYVMISAISVLIVTAFGIDFMTSMGAVAATINNIGPGLGQVGPTDNYAHLPAALKWFLSFLMMLGRLEVYTVIILLSPTFWKR